MQDVLLGVIAIAAGLVLLEAAAERFTAALGAFARHLRASEGVVGLLTAGGEWEELAVVGLALLGGHPGLAIGNIIGSCLANLIGSLPLGFLGRHPLVLTRDARIYAAVMLGVTMLAAGVLADGSIEPRWGWLLVGVFVGYLVSILVVIRRGWLRPPEAEDYDDDELPEDAGLWRLIAVMILGIIGTGIGAELVVTGGIRLARVLGLSDYVIGATIVAIGTTLPDKAISLIAGMRGQGGIVTANATGSNIFVLTLVLGVAVIGSGGLIVSRDVAHIDAPLLLSVSLLVLLLFLRRTLHRVAGIGLLALYVAYLATTLVRGA